MMLVRRALGVWGAGGGGARRWFLSGAYACEEAWARRLRSEGLRRVEASVLYHGVDECLERRGRVSVLDVDLLVSGLRDGSYKNELEDVLARVRQCPETVLVPERTTHAAIRWYMEHASKAELFDVLADRLHYGLFPDHFLANLLMDRYLEEGDPASAAKVAVLQMLQEDFGHPITRALAVHACLRYLESPEVWAGGGGEGAEGEEEEEEVKVRVKYVRRPYFDDHFDLTDTNHLVGKSLWLFGRCVEGALGSSSELLGLILYEKWEKCGEWLDELIRNKRKVHAEAVEKAREYTLRKPKQVREAEGEGGGAADERKGKVLELLGRVGEESLAKGELLSESEEAVRRAVKEHEAQDIRRQCQIYEEWEKERENEIENEIKRAKERKLSLEIEEMKRDLEREEEKLFFFEREEEIQELVKKKEEEKAQLVFFREKGERGKKDASDPRGKPQLTKH